MGRKCTGNHAEGAELRKGTDEEMHRQTDANSQPQPHAGTSVINRRHQTHRGTRHRPRDTGPHHAHTGGPLPPGHWVTGRSEPLPRQFHPPRPLPPPSKNGIFSAVLEADSNLSANESTSPQMGGCSRPAGLEGPFSAGHPRRGQGGQKGWFTCRNTARPTTAQDQRTEVWPSSGRWAELGSPGDPESVLFPHHPHHTEPRGHSTETQSGHKQVGQPDTSLGKG